MFKPMLAGKAPALDEIRYPVLASPKMDGIRCVIQGGRALSRNLKPIPNDFIRGQLEGLKDGFDGELMVEGGFNACQSAIMSRAGEPTDFFYFAFDWDMAPYGIPGKYIPPFHERLHALTDWSEECGHNNLFVVEHALISTPADLAAYEELQVGRGFEGIMVRDPNGPYKYGRSTTREGFLLKIKRWEDEEALVIGVVERMHNENELRADELGRAKRSTHKAGKVPAGDLGALQCRTPDGAEFEIGSGFTDVQRKVLWQARAYSPIGQTVTFKHQPDPGGRQPGAAPRFPIFLRFRSPE